MVAIVSSCTKLLGASLGLLNGFAYLIFALSYSLTKRDFWDCKNDKECAYLKRASRELWSLSDGAGTLAHNFIKLENGTQLHYLSHRTPPQRTGTLVVLLHGFPDSAHLFARQLNSPLSKTAKFVALDLPGCGGSDDIESYGPNSMLNAVVEAIIELKQRYIGPDVTGQCILVGHDWGGVVGFRIAAETKGLVDHVVTLNSLYPAYAEEQLRAHISRALSLISRSRFGQGFNELRPVFSQFRKSSYTYMLTLPVPMARIMPRVAFVLLKYAHSLEYHGLGEVSPDLVATQLAKAYGPSSAESSPPYDGSLGYSPSVLARSNTFPPGDFDQRVRLYSEGLLREEWTQPWHKARRRESCGAVKSATLNSSTQGTGAQHTPTTSTAPTNFKCHVTIIFGLRDVALDPRIVLNGIEKYFALGKSDAVANGPKQEDHIIRLPDCGHWSILEEAGVQALERVLKRSIGDLSGDD